MSRLIRPRPAQDPDYWAVRYRDVEGTLRTKVLGRMDRERADEERILFDAALVRRRRELRGEIEPPPEPAPSVRVLLDGFLVDGYLHQLALLDAQERRERLRMLGHVRRLLPDVALDDLNAPTTQRSYLEQRRDEGASWNTRRLEVRTWNALLHDAAARGALSAPVRPAKNIGPKDRKRIRFLERDEIARLRASLVERQGSQAAIRRVRAAVEVGLHCGLRPGEITSRRWTDFDLDRRRLRVDHVPEVGFRVKRDQVRDVPLPDELIAFLREYRSWCGPHGRWFLQENLVGVTWQVALTARTLGTNRVATTGEVAEATAELRRFGTAATPWPAFVASCLHKRDAPIINVGRAQWRANRRWTEPVPVRVQKFNNGLRSAAKAAGLEHIWPHALRHSWASLALAEGVPLHIVQAIGGWSTPHVLLDIYAHVHPDRALAAMRDFSLAGVDEEKE